MQSWNALSLMFVALPEMVTEARLVQPEKAELPMLVTGKFITL